MSATTVGPLSFNLPTEQATVSLAERLAPHLRAGDLLVLTGQLGAGKTFFTGALCHSLGLSEDEAVTSPTFTLVNEYDTVPPVSHADVYRLHDGDEVFELGLEQHRDDGRLVVVEWGGPFIEVLGGDAIELELTVDPRSARLLPANDRSRELIEALRADGAT